MSLFHLITVLITLTALFSYINSRYVQLPVTVGVMLIALILSLVMIVLGHLMLGVREVAQEFVFQMKFGDALLQWMLGFLLFAGAMHVDVRELARSRLLTATLAVGGTIISMFAVGGLCWLITHALGLGMTWIHSLLLGAVLAPTDPVAVLDVIKRINAPREIVNVIAAESLFNDGVGVVLFFTLLAMSRNEPMALGGTAAMLARQVGGGAILGFIAGLIAAAALERIHSAQVEILITLALVMGTYSLSEVLHVSGPIAVVVAGLVISNNSQFLNRARDTTHDLAVFWDLVDEILNAILFVLIGFQIVVIKCTVGLVGAGLLMIVPVIAARWLSVAGIAALFNRGGRISSAFVLILVWGGLRGGLAIAMALSLPQSAMRQQIVLITYIVVIFSILVQGTTAGALVRRLLPRAAVDVDAQRPDPSTAAVPARASE